jgi:hypothetical protein
MSLRALLDRPRTHQMPMSSPGEDIRLQIADDECHWRPVEFTPDYPLMIMLGTSAMELTAN